VYVPEKRTLQLVEMLDSVLPEDEWLIGISDLTHFRGVGFSMPVSFAEFRALQREPRMAPDEDGCEIDMESIGEGTDSQMPILHDPILTTDSSVKRCLNIKLKSSRSHPIYAGQTLETLPIASHLE
jgi:hypothetical protein